MALFDRGWSPTGKPVTPSGAPVGRNPEQEPPAKAGARAEGSARFSRTLSSLGYRDYRLLFFGTSLSHVGDFVQAMAQGWLV